MGHWYPLGVFMIAEIVATHSILVKLFLVFLIAGFFIPKMTAHEPFKFRKASFIYTMIFQAIATMIAFTGIVAMVMGTYHFSPDILLMILIWGAMMFIEIKKYKVIKVAKLTEPQTHTLLKGLFYKISAVQLFLVVVMVVLMILKAKGIFNV